MRPDQDFGMVIVLDLPLLSSKPVVGSGGELAPESRPGHTVRRHLLTILKEAGSVSAGTKMQKIRKEWASA